MSYDRLRDEQERPPKRIVDWTATWERLEPLAAVDADAAAALKRFCDAKRITVSALEQLGARIAVRQGAYWLAFAGTNGNGRVTALKYRPIGGSSHETTAEKPSTWLRPLVAGKLDSTDWLVAEGETDAARLLGLVGDVAAVLALPAGAKTFKKEWAALIPRGATVALCLDADEDGDLGAAKAAKILGGTTVRVRPPVDGTDWCDWEGDRDGFFELVKVARASTSAGAQVSRLSEAGLEEAVFVERPLLQVALTLLAGRPGVGKGALCAHWVARCTTGELYGRPMNVLWLSSEDDAAIDLGPRVEAAGGNRERVYLIPHTFQLPGDIDWLRETVETIGDVGLVIIDPLGNHTGAANTDRDSDVRVALMPLAVLANEIRVPLIGVRHISTKDVSGGALRKVLGSTAWIGVPRVVLAVANDPRDPATVHVHPIKGNRVPASEGGREFRLEGRLLPGFKESVVCAVAIGTSSADIDSLLSGENKVESGSEQARALILEMLRLAGGRMESDQLDASVAEEAGVTAKTVQNLRGELRNKGLIRSTPQRDPQGAVERWYVELTHAAETETEDEPDPNEPTHAAEINHQDNPDPSRARGYGMSGCSVSSTTSLDPEIPPSRERGSSESSANGEPAPPALPESAPDWERAYWERATMNPGPWPPEGVL